MSSAKLRSIKKRTFLAKLESTLGNISESCKAANIDRNTYYNWLKADPVFAEAVDTVAELNLDFAESCLKRQIKDGNTTATIFYLKTKGKARGYVETYDVRGNIAMRTNYYGMTAEELKEEAARLKDIIDQA